MNRATEMAAFLAQSGWGDARRVDLAGDASGRRYFRLTLGGQTAVLMDAPPGQPDDPAQFLAVAAHLAAIGLSPPACLAKDLVHGFLLLQDLGDDLLARVIESHPDREMPLMRAAVDVLIHLQSRPALPGLPDLTAAEWAESAMLVITENGGTNPEPLQTALTQALIAHADGPRVMILRDYHAENLLHLPDRAGLSGIGLLDFQTAQMGQPAYDLVSLLQDARRDVSVEPALRDYFSTQPGFSAQYATIGTLRALRIIGIFARLNRLGKPGYLRFLPRVFGHLRQNLAHPELAELRAICDKMIPPRSA